MTEVTATLDAASKISAAHFLIAYHRAYTYYHYLTGTVDGSRRRRVRGIGNAH